MWRLLEQLVLWIRSLRMDKVVGSAVTDRELNALLGIHDKMVWNSMDSSANCRAVSPRYSAAAGFTDNAADPVQFDPWHRAVISNALVDKLVEHPRMIPEGHPRGYTAEGFNDSYVIDNKVTYTAGTPWELIVRG